MCPSAYYLSTEMSHLLIINAQNRLVKYNNNN